MWVSRRVVRIVPLPVPSPLDPKVRFFPGRDPAGARRERVKRTETHAKPHTCTQAGADGRAHGHAHAHVRRLKAFGQPKGGLRPAFGQPRHFGPPHNVRTQSGNPKMSKNSRFGHHDLHNWSVEDVDPIFHADFSQRFERGV